MCWRWLAALALAKLPPPDDAAKAKAAETAAKAAWQAKVDGYQLCKAQDKVAAAYMKTAGKAARKDAKPAPVAAPAAAARPCGAACGIRHARGLQAAAALRRSGAVRLQPAGAKAPGNLGRAFAHRHGRQPAERQAEFGRDGAEEVSPPSKRLRPPRRQAGPPAARQSRFRGGPE